MCRPPTPRISHDSAPCSQQSGERGASNTMESRKEEVPDSKRRSQVNEYGTSASDLVICGHGLADRAGRQHSRPGETDEEGC